MKVEVRLFADLREVAKRKVLTVNLPSGGKVLDVARKLGERLGPDFRSRMFNERGQLSGSLRILVNGQNIASLRGAGTELKEGDVVAIFPPVAGGGVKIAGYKGDDFRIDVRVSIWWQPWPSS